MIAATRSLVIPLLLLIACAAALALAPRAGANTSHQGWPAINGMLLMNKNDADRPLDARPGYDPFGGEDPTYSCDTIHEDSTCVGQPRKCRFHGTCRAHVTVSGRAAHNELLGGHGNDRIHAGPWGDVIWGDYKPSGQPSGQTDRLWGGDGHDIIFASHGTNIVRAGGGDDWIKAHWGRGIIDCGGGTDVLYISRHAQHSYRVSGCETISHTTLGY